MNYITETFTFIRLAVLAGWSWFQDLLDALGFSWSGYLAILIGFACVGYIVSIAMEYFRGSAADSIVSPGINSYHRNKASFERKQLYAQRGRQINAYIERTKLFREHMKGK